MHCIDLRFRILVSWLWLSILTGVAVAEPVFFPRYPTLSPDGSTICFSFQGDLWTVAATGGTASRITANPAYDKQPVYSKDGSKIAFASDRNGTFDVFVMSSSGSIPERLSFSAATDLPCAFSGNDVLFTTRGQFDYPLDYQLFHVPSQGGTPFRVIDCFVEDAALSNDGKTYALAIGNNYFGRKAYRGSDQSDLWRWDGKSEPVQLTTHAGYDSDPMWSADGKFIYYRSDSSGVFNLWRMNVDGSAKQQITSFSGDGIRRAEIAQAASRIVLEADSSLYLLDLAERAKPVRIKIDVASDLLENPIQYKTYSREADELSICSDASEFAMVIRGEIVLKSKDLEGRAALPAPSPARDWQVSYKPGCVDTLLFTTDRWGMQQLALLISDSAGLPLRKSRKPRIVRLTKDSVESRMGQWSPLGDQIAYIRGNGEIRVMNADGSNDHKLLSGWAEPGFTWSPDGRWIAYARDDHDYNSDIWIVAADGSTEPVNISQHPDEDSGPVWSKDGSTIAWNTRRHENQFDVMFVYLKRADDERTPEQWKEWEKSRDKKKKDDADSSKGKERDKKAKKAAVEPVVIDFADIHLRVRRLTGFAGDERVVAIHPKADRYYFAMEYKGKSDLASVDRFGEDLKMLSENGTNATSVTLDADGKSLFFLKGGAPASIGIEGGKPENYSFSAALKIDLPAERLQVLDEGWRTLNRGFYDPDMHGMDWKSLRKKYRVYASRVSHDRDFEDVCELMLGELNASHMGYNGGRALETQAGAELGIEFDESYSGEGLRIKSVLPYGPLDKASGTITPGAILTSIDGQPLSREVNWQALLEQKANLPVELTFRENAVTKSIITTPVDWFTLRQLCYRKLQDDLRKQVTQATSGRVGYIHIQGMSTPSLELFERDLYAAAEGKEALIIDVRNNGGGSTTDLLLTILTQPQHAYTIGRDGETGYPQDRLPLYRWTKPIAVLCNENSFSNAEIFANAIQTIHRGPVIGTRTAGGIISTGGWGTINGGYFRLPLRGWYIFGTTINQENHGCIPEFPIPYTPGDRMKRRDPQLEKSIELMINAANAERKLPGVDGKPRR